MWKSNKKMKFNVYFLTLTIMYNVLCVDDVNLKCKTRTSLKNSNTLIYYVIKMWNDADTLKPDGGHWFKNPTRDPSTTRPSMGLLNK